MEGARSSGGSSRHHVSTPANEPRSTRGRTRGEEHASGDQLGLGDVPQPVDGQEAVDRRRFAPAQGIPNPDEQGLVGARRVKVFRVVRDESEGRSIRVDELERVLVDDDRLADGEVGNVDLVVTPLQKL